MPNKINGLRLLMLEFINETGVENYNNNPKEFLNNFFIWVTDNKSFSESFYNTCNVYSNSFSKKVYLDLMIQFAYLNNLSDEELVISLNKLLSSKDKMLIK